MPISTNTLFHFTNSLQHVISILTHDFRPHYSLENLNVLAPMDEYLPSLEFAIPMVCFCDIPLSAAAQHMAVYGSYGIGLTKEWGRNHGIAPVLYTYPDSGVAKRLRDLVKGLFNEPIDTVDAENVQDHFFDFSCFIKPYEGHLTRSGRYKDQVRFYDEREWRYVSRSMEGEYRYGLTKQEFAADDLREAAQKDIFDRDRVKFVPSDVKYVILAKESEILKLIQKIERVKGRYAHNEVKVLTSRIISAEQIESDF